MNEIKIDIWSDIACPWCYVGEKIFNQVLISFVRKLNNLSSGAVKI